MFPHAASMVRAAILAAGLASVASLQYNILGGHPVSWKSHPYIAQLQMLYVSYCGGAVIGPHWVLTAAHCTHQVPAASLQVRTATDLLSSGGVVHPVVRTLTHEQYVFKEGHSFNDIALVLVRGSMLGGGVKPVPVVQPQADHLVTGSAVTIAGWGLTAANGSASPVLLEVVVPVTSQEYCVSRYPLADSRMFCAGFQRGGKDACQGDSGGPAVHRGVLVGVVSFGRGCGEAGMPGVYTRLASFHGWLARKMAEAAHEQQ